eukprot:NODE_804_length_605_cov_324.119247_g795_i0.p1 GENE.NODE_804_length_605_cov_324.119247_g795_i0~~NODE_804_length_605_cov_324.119247_g795_i0.p1  ORF type:complete len:105 (-),score=36.15 NODE_804_length_605_cov_324.119247_g795_i0:239-553(-)
MGGRGDSDLLSNRGELLRKMGDNDGALQDLTDAIQADPNCVEAYMYRANLYGNSLGDLQAAVEDCRAALDLGAQDQDLITMKENFEAQLGGGESPTDSPAESPT